MTNKSVLTFISVNKISVCLSVVVALQTNGCYKIVLTVMSLHYSVSILGYLYKIDILDM